MRARREVRACEAALAIAIASAVASASASPSASPSARAEPAPAASARAKREPEAPPRAVELTVEELDKRLAALESDDVTARRAAAKALGELGEESVPAIGKKLAELHKVPAASVAAAVKAAKGRAGGDLCDKLVEATGGGTADAGAKAALATAALIRPLARARTTTAARLLVKIAGQSAGAFRAEVTRQLPSLGDAALPALVEARRDPAYDVRPWAANQLEAMGKRLPSDAVQTKDHQVLAEVLRAYASVKDLDALPVILSFVNADRVQVRTAAREAIGAFDQDAQWKLREAYANVANKPAAEGWTAAETAKELFATYDRMRLQEVYGLLDEGLDKERQGKHDEAIAAFDKVLARQPALDRRAEMAPAYLARAQRLAGVDRQAALGALLEAQRLAEGGPNAPRIEAELAYLQGEELASRGVIDVEPFQRALSLDPGHAKARAALDRLEAVSADRAYRVQWLAAAAATVVAILLATILFVGRRRPRALGARTAHDS